ncbi:MAG TPA: DUF503 domain-containing protein [Armatimonadota bacterium]|nr:DUF503 domain-containing protein [Armatimonadota bacterium]
MEPVVGVLTADLFIADALTLKDRRRVVKSLLDRLTNRHNVSAADLGPDQRPHNATLAVSAVANDAAHVHRVLDAALRMIEAEPRAVCERSQISVL